MNLKLFTPCLEDLSLSVGLFERLRGLTKRHSGENWGSGLGWAVSYSLHVLVEGAQCLGFRLSTAPLATLPFGPGLLGGSWSEGIYTSSSFGMRLPRPYRRRAKLWPLGLNSGLRHPLALALSALCQNKGNLGVSMPPAPGIFAKYASTLPIPHSKTRQNPLSA